jgi:outer membrane protein OmpA-like peptidoglycan-associated protein
MRRFLAGLTTGSLLLSLVSLVVAAPASAAAACTTQLTPMHRPVEFPNAAGPFYVDFGRNLTSNWIGYRVASGAAATPYVKLSLTKGAGDLRIAPNGYDTIAADAASQGVSGATMAYFYLTANSVFTSAVSFTATLYDGDPGASGTAVCEFTDGFTRADDIIAANPNSISSITTSVSGNIATVTAVGSTGTMGNPTKDYIGTDGVYRAIGSSSTSGNTQRTAFNTAISMDPTWDATNWVLQGMTITKTGGSSYYDKIRFYLTKADIEGGYAATYILKRVAPTTAATLKPRQVIASGNELKYTGSLPGGAVSINPPSDISMVKTSVGVTSVSSTNCSGASPCYQADYRVVFSNASTSSAVTVTNIVDTPSSTSPATWYYKTGSAALSSTNSVTGTYTAAGGGSPNRIVFTDIVVPAGTVGTPGTDTLTYSLYVTGTTQNSIAATAGGLSLSSNSITILSPSVQITTTTIPGTIDGDGNYATDIEKNNTDVCAWSAAVLPSWLEITTPGGSLRVKSGQQAVAGTYTFTVTVDCGGGSTDTQDLTLNVLGITTTSLPSVCEGDGYNRTLTAVGGSGYTWARTAGSLPTGLSLNSGNGQISGIATVAGTYTFTAEVTSGSLSSSKSLSIAVVVCQVNQVITFPQVPNMIYGGANPSSTPTASSGLPVTVTNNTPSVCTYSGGVITYLSVGTCSLTATQPGNRDFFAATPVTMSFTISPAPVTVTAEPKSKAQGDADPAFTSTIAGMVRGETATGVTYTRAPGETPGSYVITPAGGSFSANYTVRYVNGTLTINVSIPGAPGAGSYTPVTMINSTLTWGPSATAGVTYEAYYNGAKVCTTSATQCAVERIIGPASKVTVLAVNRFGNKSGVTTLVYKFDKPIIAVTVYFDVDKSIISKAQRREVLRVSNILKREGFSTFVVRGYTDSDASAAYNKALSNRRSVALNKLASTVLEAGDFTVTGKGFEDPAAPNTTPKGKSLNRRSVLYING